MGVSRKKPAYKIKKSGPKRCFSLTWRQCPVPEISVSSFVAIKMGRRQGDPSRTGIQKAHPAPFLYRQGRPERYEYEKRCGMAASLPPVRLGPALKISQLTPPRRGESHAYFGDRRLKYLFQRSSSDFSTGLATFAATSACTPGRSLTA